MTYYGSEFWRLILPENQWRLFPKTFRCWNHIPKPTGIYLLFFIVKLKLFFSVLICVWACSPCVKGITLHQLAPFCPFPFDSVEDSRRDASQNRLVKESDQLISALLGSLSSPFVVVWLWGKSSNFLLMNFLCDTLSCSQTSKIYQIGLKLMSQQ